jgi:AmmeMemoRadiSam system protein A
MSTDRGAFLIALARAAIARALDVPAISPSAPAWALKRGASFVTLTQDGELRGCVGTVRPRCSLLDDVARNAVSAALHDRRFRPVTADGIGSVVIEVSVLSALHRLPCTTEEEAIRELRPGVDGVLLEYRDKRGTFLPQVWEVLSDPQHFLAELKAKTNLSREFWSDEISLWRYTVTKWKENELKQAA